MVCWTRVPFGALLIHQSMLPFHIYTTLRCTALSLERLALCIFRSFFVHSPLLPLSSLLFSSSFHSRSFVRSFVACEKQNKTKSREKEEEEEIMLCSLSPSLPPFLRSSVLSHCRVPSVERIAISAPVNSSQLGSTTLSLSQHGYNFSVYNFTQVLIVLSFKGPLLLPACLFALNKRKILSLHCDVLSVPHRIAIYTYCD